MAKDTLGDFERNIVPPPPELPAPPAPPFRTPLAFVGYPFGRSQNSRRKRRYGFSGNLFSIDDLLGTTQRRKTLLGG